MSFLRRFVPLLQQLSEYDRRQLRGDLSAGLTVGVMLIPQGMAYALIAGLPPIYGLYASLVPLIVYAVFGSSRQLAVGPVAMVSLLVAAAVGPMAEGQPELYVGLAVLLSLMVGALQFGLGIARFGFLVNFLSHPVLSGFTSAAAFIIGLSQLKHLLGVDLPRSNYVHEIVWAAAGKLGAADPLTVALGGGSILLLVALRRLNRSLPGALVVVVITTGLVWAFGLDEHGVAIVGSVPGGLPPPTVPPLDWGLVQQLAPSALAIGLVGFMESIAVAQAYARRHRYEVDANQELVGLGLANLAGAFFSAYPTTGGLSRTAVNDEAGANTNLAGLVSAGIIALTLLVLTPLFYYLPDAVLAAIIMVAVTGLVEWEEALRLWRVDRRDLGLMALTFVATLGLGIEQGILIGVVVSLIVVIYQSSTPHTAIMGRLPGTQTYRNLKRNPEALTQSETVIVRMDANLYFATVSPFRDLLTTVDTQGEALRAIVVDMYPVNQIDSTGVDALEEVIESCRRKGIALYFAGVKGPVKDVLEAAGVPDEVGRDRFVHEVHTAVQAAEAAVAETEDPTATPSETDTSS